MRAHLPRRALVAAAVALVASAPAGAARAPSSPEATGIRAAFHAYLQMPQSPAAHDNKIVWLKVSSLDSRYAAARLLSKSAGPSDMVFHRSGPGWFVVGFGSSLGCDTAPKAVLDDLRIGCTPPGSTAWISNCGALLSKPKSVVLACGDGNYYLVSLRWHSWGSARATATGVATANDCNPYCAAGHFHSYPVGAVATRLRSCGRARYYSLLTVSYPGTRPAHYPKTSRLALSC